MTESRICLKAGYYDDFRCKCGECRYTCCQAWIIGLDKEEHLRIIGTKCSDLLRSKLDVAYQEPKEKDSKHYRVVAFDDRGYCPMLDIDGLCMLQKECGEEIMASVCRTYPRRIRYYSGYCDVVSCANSCESVIELLLNTDKLELVNREKLLSLGAPGQCEALVDLLNALDTVQDRSMPLEKRIAQLCGEDVFKDQEKYFKISLLNMKAILDMRLGIKETLMRYDCDEAYEKYCDDIAEFEKKYPNWQFYFENILSNHLLVMGYPSYVTLKQKVKDAKCGLKNVYAFMRIVSAAYTCGKEGLTPFVDALAALFRTVEQWSFYKNIEIVSLFSEMMEQEG